MHIRRHYDRAGSRTTAGKASCRSVQNLYRDNHRDVFVGPAPALIAIDLYEYVFRGGPGPVSEVAKTYPSACGEYAWAAIPPTKRLFSAARAARIPIFYSTMETRPDAQPSLVAATKKPVTIEDELFAIRADFAPEPGDTIVRKARASAFFGTLLSAHLVQLGVQSVIMIGSSTSGCLRAEAPSMRTRTASTSPSWRSAASIEA